MTEEHQRVKVKYNKEILWHLHVIILDTRDICSYSQCFLEFRLDHLRIYVDSFLKLTHYLYSLNKVLKKYDYFWSMNSIPLLHAFFIPLHHEPLNYKCVSVYCCRIAPIVFSIRMLCL